MYVAGNNGRPTQINQQYLKKIAEMYERNHPGCHWNCLSGPQQIAYYEANVWRVKRR